MSYREGQKTSKVRETQEPSQNKLDEMAGGDAKKAQLALSSDGPYKDEIGKEGNGPGSSL